MLWGAGVGTGAQSEVKLRAFIGFVYPKMRRLSQGIHQQSATLWRALDKAERLPRDAQWKLWCWWWSPSLELTAGLHSREKTSIRAVALRASVWHLFLEFSELAQRRPWKTWIYFLKIMNINLNKCMYIQPFIPGLRRRLKWGTLCRSSQSAFSSSSSYVMLLNQLFLKYWCL